jgi:Xaa-Pro aminopeptidase
MRRHTALLLTSLSLVPALAATRAHAQTQQQRTQRTQTRATPSSSQTPPRMWRSDTPVFTDALPVAEFVARRAQIMEHIGDGVAILQGAAERTGEQPFRQANVFFYLTGVETPRAIVVIDGRAKTSRLYLQDMSARLNMYGPLLNPNTDAPKLTGMDAVLVRDSFAVAVDALEREHRIVYTPFRSEVTLSTGSGEANGFWRATKNDPWDGRVSREDAFIAKLKAAAPDVEVRPLDAIVDSMRAIKTPREIALIREATRLAGLGIMEAMRDARPGMHEYELQADAEYVFKKGGAQGAAYFPLVATGTNTRYTHYYKNMGVLQDGDLVQFDYAPDYRYYVSDVTRVFPANGHFDARQREFYTIYLRLYQALMTSIKPYAAPRDIIRDAVVKMDAIMASYKFTDPRIEAAAKQFVDRYRNNRGNSLGHSVGIEVHDVGLMRETLQPGHIFTIEPQMTIADEHLGLRLEDVILITDNGYENLSAFVPLEIADIEKLMKEKGLSDAALRLPK